ncbi:dihydrodipicolinate synthase family protein [Nocardioides sp.]|uniref:dihydrodipicolinate synthase family protein n=1 Tax=Nocardioides sp. TaxID=35761 RepID=UPI0019AAD1F1|nr:dihydrodipicolinate synthase family protein [Nocardioides sp.]MBC7274939.1 dihydrodipicolinate synthase family protein [Nocardioides sp.]
MTSVRLPLPDGGTELHTLAAPRAWTKPRAPFTSRTAYAAAHVVPRTLAENVPGAPADIDWDRTLAYRHELWSYGLGVAEAMDTAQRGMGLDWTAAAELIRRSAAEAATVGGSIACGAGTDQLALDAVPEGRAGLATVIDAYREQMKVVADNGATTIVMASRALARVARSPEDYAEVYATLLDEAEGPVILHWLGDMFDPALAGYWGSSSVAEATETFLDVIRARAGKVDGVKVSLLDAEHEVGLRRALPGGVRLYTGDDFNYPELIVGEGTGEGEFSHALLGIFAAIYPAASAALQALDDGDREGARELLESTQALGRKIFEAPTYYYKTGIAFLSWLGGHQPGFSMAGGLHAGRSVPHLVEVFRLADAAGLLTSPDLAAARMRAFLTVQGVDQ